MGRQPSAQIPLAVLICVTVVATEPHVLTDWHRIVPLMAHSKQQPPGPPVQGHDWTQYPRAGEDAWVLVPQSVRTTWCSESGILVRDYDHFCPWTGTTIAGGNMCAHLRAVSLVSLQIPDMPWRHRCCFHTFIYSLCGACIFVVLVGITAAGVAAEEAGQNQPMTG